MSGKSSTIGRRRDVTMTMRILSVVVVAAALAGCNTYRVKEPIEVPNDYRKRHQIGLREGARSVELFVGQGRGSLNPTQRADVSAFAQTWKRESTSGIVVEVPHGSPNQVAASQAAREARSILMASGMPAQTIAMRTYVPENPAHLPTVRLSYAAIKADSGPCGLWPTDLGPAPEPFYAENKPYWNLGCANQRNLAAMVDNPADLVQPRSETPAWTSRRTTVLEKYRLGVSAETIYPNKSQGTISDVGNNN